SIPRATTSRLRSRATVSSAETTYPSRPWTAACPVRCSACIWKGLAPSFGCTTRQPVGGCPHRMSVLPRLSSVRRDWPGRINGCGALWTSERQSSLLHHHLRRLPKHLAQRLDLINRHLAVLQPDAVIHDQRVLLRQVVFEIAADTA